MSYIFCKPEPLGEKFNTLSCFVIGIFLYLEIKIEKEDIKYIKYHHYVEETRACMKIMMKSTKGLGKSN